MVFQNNGMRFITVYQTNFGGVQLFLLVNTFFCSNKFAWLLDKWVHTLYFRVQHSHCVWLNPNIPRYSECLSWSHVWPFSRKSQWFCGSIAIFLRSKSKEKLYGFKLKTCPFCFVSWYLLLLEFQNYQYPDLDCKHGSRKFSVPITAETFEKGGSAQSSPCNVPIRCDFLGIYPTSCCEMSVSGICVPW